MFDVSALLLFPNAHFDVVHFFEEFLIPFTKLLVLRGEGDNAFGVAS